LFNDAGKSHVTQNSMNAAVRMRGTQRTQQRRYTLEEGQEDDEDETVTPQST